MFPVQFNHHAFIIGGEDLKLHSSQDRICRSFENLFWIAIPIPRFGQSQRHAKSRPDLFADGYSWLFVSSALESVDFEEILKKKGWTFTSISLEQISK